MKQVAFHIGNIELNLLAFTRTPCSYLIFYQHSKRNRVERKIYSTLENSDMTEEFDESELECRVCRMGIDLPNRILYTPCLCSGSIGLVHQDCLEAWLAHSNKDKCELCGLKYQFTPQYADNTPTEIPVHVMAFTIVKKALKDYIPCVFNFVLAIIVWLKIVPFFTCQLFRMWMRLDSFTIDGMQSRIYQDTTTGIVLTGFIILTFIVMVGFSLYTFQLSLVYVSPSLNNIELLSSLN